MRTIWTSCGSPPHRRLTRPEVTPRAARTTLVRGLGPLVALLPSVPPAFVEPTAAMLPWLLIWPVSVVADLLIPDAAEEPGRAD